MPEPHTGSKTAFFKGKWEPIHLRAITPLSSLGWTHTVLASGVSSSTISNSPSGLLTSAGPDLCRTFLLMGKGIC